MTSFSTVFKLLQAKKAKKILMIYLIQLAAIMAIGTYLYLVNAKEFQSIFVSYEVIALTTSFFALLISWCILFIDEIKMYESQTWQLLPISSKKFFLANILTTYVTLFYMALLDLGTCAILISVAFAASKPELKDISVGKTLGQLLIGEIALYGLGIALLIALGLISFSLMINFLSFSSKTIVNLLPGFKSKKLVGLLRFIFAIVLYAILTYFINTFSNVFEKGIIDRQVNLLVLWLSVAETGIFVLIGSIVDTWIYQKFFEAKAV